MSGARQVPQTGDGQQLMRATTIAFVGVVVVLLGAAGLAYNQGWFSSSDASTELESNKVGVNQTIDQEKTKEAPMEITRKAAEPSNVAAE